MAKINLRDLNAHAKQWDHPIKGLLKNVESMKKYYGDILKLSKKERERYCLSIFGLALRSDSNVDWWVHIPNTDPPDGLVITFNKEENGQYMGYMREVEVVEHRGEPGKLFDTIRNKMVENSYEPNTILNCLILTPAIYDMKGLSKKLSQFTSPLKHVFVVFSGIVATKYALTSEEVQSKYTVVQLLPVFQTTTFDLRSHLQDFSEQYEEGRESRLIEGKGIYYGTANPTHTGVLPIAVIPSVESSN